MPENTCYPVVIVPGIGQSKVARFGPDGQPQQIVWPFGFDKDRLIGALKGPFMKTVLLRRDAGLSDAIAAQLSEMIGGFACGPDGSPKENVRAITYPYPLSDCTPEEKRYINVMAPVNDLAASIGEENIFFFAFNSFDRPYTVAQQLHDFIAMVKSRTGSSRVNILALSLGGAMLTAYLDAFGAEELHRIFYIVPALQGTQLIGDLFRKNLIADKGAGLLGVLVGESAAKALEGVFAMLPAGVTEAIAEKCMQTVRTELLANSGAMWACLPPEYYAPLAGELLGDPAHAALRAQTDRYHAAQTALRETLLGLKAQGHGVFICASYGMRFPEAFGSADAFSADGVIDIRSASLGAESSAPGQPPAFAEKIGSPFISPDGTLNAAAGAFPESTWYFRGQYHDSIAYNDTALAVALSALSDKTFTDNYSDPACGQVNERQDNREQNA
jgi:hypothetical protein